MKRETLHHPKTYDLMARLQCSRPTVLGYLQLLWDYTGQMAPMGNIGKWPNTAIAQACDWEDDPETFIAALIAAGWLDEVQDPDVRLLVHDWGDHCEKFVQMKLKRAGAGFHPLYGYVGTPLERRPDGVRTVTGRRRCLPILSNPQPGQSNPIQEEAPSAPLSSDDDPPGGLTVEELVKQWNATPGVRKVREITRARRDAFRTRSKDAGWLAQIAEALERVGKSAFCAGQNDRKWKATIDWFLKPNSTTKLLEGVYDSVKGGKGPEGRGRVYE